MRHVSTKLLHVFVLLMEYRDLSAVAACTQSRVPTIAYSLARLREITGDPLFIKRNGTLEPTAHALRLEQTARQILSKWAHLVRPLTPAAEASSPHRRISIGFSPSIGDPVITEILTTLCEQFPDDRFMTRPVVADSTLAAQLGSGELDCAFVVDSHYVPDHVALHNIMATPRRLVSVARPGGHDNAQGRHEWILLQEDTEPGSPLQGFLNRLAHDPDYRETVVPSWHTQVALLLAAGGICPLLDFNVPLVTRHHKTRLLAPPSSFPEWAALHFWAPTRANAGKTLLGIMEIGSAVLHDPVSAIDRRHQAHESRTTAYAA
ncbi:LysR substrate-binding domain-containing protein [Cupriavidus sp. 2MCAB6]|uniref:LysR substrate-binding domain-containing protein n=1 Tax=Cupriavidus sp. 2MCAB6 TaxID=3232981 RepID=UPI003F9081EF